MDFLAASLNPLTHVRDNEMWGSELYKYGVGKHMTMFCIAGALTLLVFWIRAGQVKTEKVPGRFGNLIESVMFFLRDQVVRPFMGQDGDRFLPFVWAFFFFILFNNLLGLIPFFDYISKEHGGNTATANIGLTGALAVCSFVMYHFMGVREAIHHHKTGLFVGLIIYIKNLFPRVPWPVYAIIIPIEIVAHLVRPCALAIRLFANMTAGHTLVAAILMFSLIAKGLPMWAWGGVSLVSCLTVVALTFLELLVAFIQAFVFAFLSTVFLSMAVHPEH